MSKSKLQPTLTDVLRAAIRQSGLTPYRIGKDTGLVVTSVIRFVEGETSLRLDKAGALAEYLGLRLIPDPEAKRPETTPANLARPTLARRQPKRKAK